MRKLLLLLLPLLLLGFAACSDGKDDNGAGSPTDTPDATSDATDAAEPTDAPTSTPYASGTNGGTSGASALFETFNPLELFSGAGAPSSTQTADPALEALLLTLSDLPGGFTSLGEFSYNVPTEYGDAEMVASMFSRGDFLSGNFDAIVMSAVTAMPPDARAELGDPSELANITDADLDEIRQASGEFGSLFQDLSLLDGSGLGEGGAGMHMTMDFGAIFEQFAAPQEENPFAGGLAMDMYMFVQGDNLLMTMVMWPADQSPLADGRSLAEAMDAKVG